GFAISADRRSMKIGPLECNMSMVHKRFAIFLDWAMQQDPNGFTLEEINDAGLIHERMGRFAEFMNRQFVSCVTMSLSGQRLYYGAKTPDLIRATTVVRSGVEVAGYKLAPERVVDYVTRLPASVLRPRFV